MLLFTQDSYRISHRLNILRQILIITILWYTEISYGRLSKVKIMRSIDGQVDRILFPRELCEVTSAEDVGCGVRMQVEKAQSCSCTCNQTEPANTSYVKTTLGYYNGSWKCWNNAKLRKYAGCNLLSIGEAITDPILDIFTGKSYVFKIPTNQECRVDAANSTYLTCNGTSSLLHERILRRNVNTSTRFTRNQIVIEHTGVLESRTSFSGRVIRLAVQCRKSGKSRNVGCIVIKAKGNLACPIVIPTKKSSEGSKAKTVTIATTTKIIPTKKSSGSKAKTVTIATTTKILTPGSPGRDRKQLHGPKTEAITSNVIKKQKQTDKTFVKTMAVIIGALLSLVLTVMIVIFLVVMVMKSNKTKVRRLH